MIRSPMSSVIFQRKDNMRNFAIVFCACVLLLGTANAGTVIITGTCNSNLAPGNFLNFALFNNGTDTAYSLLISPIIPNALPAENTYSISSLPSGVNTATKIGLLNITGRGSYASALILNYQQGQQTFTALFPCMVNFGNATNSTLRVFPAANTLIGNSSNIVKIGVNITNGGNNNLDANVSILVPPTFRNLSSSSYLITIGPFQTKSLVFTYALPPGQVSYSAAISASYTLEGLHYASIATLILRNYIPPSSSTNSQTYLFVGIVVIILLLLLLIVRSIIKRRKGSVDQPNTSQ